MTRRALATLPLLLVFAAAVGFAQAPPEATPSPTPAPAPEAAPSPAAETTPASAAEATPAPVVEPPPAAIDSRALLDQLGGCVESGELHVEVDLVPGSVPAAPAWTVVTSGTPLAKLTAEASRGSVRRFHFDVSNGRILVDGRGLRPNVYVEALTFEEGKGITDAKFRGKGIWRPIVGIFRGLAMSALRKLQFRTDVPSVLRGEILAASAAPPKKGAPAPKPAPAPPAAAGAPPPPAAGPSFLDLVKEVRVADSALVAFPDKPLGFGETIRFRTAAGKKVGFPLRVTVDRGVYHPAAAGGSAQIELAGRIDGEIADGAVGFGESRSTFSHGELRGGSYRVRSVAGGAFETELSAAAFGVDLTSGDFHVPGGPQVAVDAPSRFAVRDLKVRPDGKYSGLVDADLRGKVGRLARGGTVVSASDFRIQTEGLRVADGAANGDLELAFKYRVEYPLVVKYPVAELPEKRVPLVFEGPFSTRLHLEDAGTDSGSVTGDYGFKAPWPPIERAALELLSARWSQDVTAAVKKVEFDIQPRRFGPCGGTCFVVDLEVTAQKKRSGKRLFRQICNPEGKADLVVDAATRSFQLKNIKLETRCKGIVGWVVNFLSPFLTKTYTDMTVFQMPPNLPFTIESVGSGANYVAIAGRVAWEAGKEGPATQTPPPK